MKRFFTLCILTAIYFPAFTQSEYWQQEVHYTIDVALDDRDHTLDGFLSLQYTNHSPDTLHFIWFHLWPNAFRNDQTAFSEQLLRNGRTDFYFANKEKRGYINRLNFRIDNVTLRLEDHPQYIDVVKVYLPAPLGPGQQTVITTPFHVKLPANFSRGGHTGRSYQVTQWYPKPAVYDRKGWHPMPYLDQGEFYSEFGSYDVRITLPVYYVVASTGELQSGEFRVWPGQREVISQKKPGNLQLSPIASAKKNGPPKRLPLNVPQSETGGQPVMKTLQYKQSGIHDFAWFADTAFVVKEDTVQLPSGRAVKAFSFYRSTDNEGWQHSMQYIKDAVHFRSQQLGEYPYNVVTVVEAVMGFSGGMEYPTITSVSPLEDSRSLDVVIQHEIGHNWFYGALASNERDHPWMDEGMNSFYDNRYKAWKYSDAKAASFMDKRLPEDPALLLADAAAKQKEDQPISTASADFTAINYGLTAYTKAAAWMKKLEVQLGRGVFDSCMRTYYRQWQFKHPYPEDFRAVVEKVSGRDVQEIFALLHKKGPLEPPAARKKIKPVFLFSFKDYKNSRYIGWLPVLGYNHYDKLMLGVLLHNYNLPKNNFQFVLAPMYATNSKQFNGTGLLNYSWSPKNGLKRIGLGVGGSAFSMLSNTDSNGRKVFGRFYRLTPSLRLTFNNKNPHSLVEKWVEWKTFLIGERGFDYALNIQEKEFQHRYLNQLSFSVTDYRVLYPYDVRLQLQQGEKFYRANATAHYFFNYAKGGGMQVRLFAAKFGYIGQRTLSEKFATSLYHPKLTAVRGYEDYTYSNYFLGRNEFEGFASQQIMMRDGGLKLRVDQFEWLTGRSDNWVASVNFVTTLPPKMFPVKLPVKIFLDAGTYAEAWKKGAETSRFLYVAGLQLSLFKDLLHVYAPVLYSKEFRDQLKTLPEENKFFKRLSFSIDIHRFNLKELIRY